MLRRAHDRIALTALEAGTRAKVLRLRRSKSEPTRCMPRFAHDRIARTGTIEHITNGWVRDLTEEGIEPNPGPRYLSKNINGLCDPHRRESVYQIIMREHLRDPIGAVFIQEHHWHKDVAEAAKRLAASYRLLLIAAHIPRGERKGGTPPE